MQSASRSIDRNVLDELLLGASRTFAINIPMMPGVLRDSLTLAYLLLRNADTLEDAYRWPKQERISGLDELYDLMIDPDPDRARRFGESYRGKEGIEDPKHLELLTLTPYLLEQISLLPDEHAAEVRAHVARVIRCMQAWVRNHDDQSRLRIERIKELDDYCYSVAGIVGELCTSLILLYRPDLRNTHGPLLRTLETSCGAGLQLTNIIKDVFRDHQEGRYYIPKEYLPFENGGSVSRIMPMLAYAYRFLCLGRDYVCALPEEDQDIRRAVLVPLMLAVATLVRLLEKLDELFDGIEVKISRLEVIKVLSLADGIAESNKALRQAWDRLSGPLLDLTVTSLSAVRA